MAQVLLTEKLDMVKEIIKKEWPAITLGGAICFMTGRYVIHAVKCRDMKSKMAERKKKSKDGMEKLRKSLTHEDVDSGITQLPFEELRAGLLEGRLTSASVLKAYQVKAFEVNDVVNAITDVIDSAQTQAALLDKTDPPSRGPLHGIPISIKESVGLKGQDCTAGFGLLIDNPLPDDSVLVKVMKSAGAIPFVRTNLPQGMRSFASDNPIYGLTVNPCDPQRGPGGSSGGEGAIVGGGGSILGIGSDIGGSIRIPCCFCGIPGLKPTSNRLSPAGNFGYGTNTGGQRLVPPSYGPMGQDVDSLVHFMRAALGPEMFTLDPTTPPILFNEEMFQNKRPLKIGFYVYDGMTLCVPAVVRAVHTAKKVLESLGHTVEEFQPPDVSFAIDEILFPAFFGDECESYVDLVNHDNTCDIMYDWVKFCQYPYIVRWLAAKWKEWTANDPQNASLLKRPTIRNVSQWFKKSRDAKAYQAKFFQQWTSQGLDVVICPCMPSVAYKHGLDRKQLVTITYTGLYNVMNYPAGTLPITKVTADDVTKVKDPSFYLPATDIEKELQKDFEEGSEGMPVGIQVVGLPYREEMVLRVMKELETSLTGSL